MVRRDIPVILLVFLFVFHSIVITGYIIYQTQDIITGRATAQQGKVSFCINNQPRLNLTSCTHTLTEDVDYYCLANATDLDSDTLLFYSEFITSRTVFTMTPMGIISFTPTNDDIGNHTSNISVNDSICPGISMSELFSFEVQNVNDPPYLNLSIPDQFLLENTQLRAFFLDNHFTDPDNDPLTYTHTLTGDFEITIADSSQVTITPLTCPSENYIIFIASDPYNLTADSNLVKLNCSIAATPAEEVGTEGGSGGGGGGGGASLCIPKLFCYDWEECLQNNTQRKKCFDENGCKKDIIYMIKECEYIAQCHNNIQDANEGGIDCGGPCTPCPTCTDNKKNGKEEDIDCGGTCEACFDSLIAFAEYEPISGYDDKTVKRTFTLKTLNVQQKKVTSVATNLPSLPLARFSTNATTLFFLDDNDLWLATQGITKRITHTNDILSFGHLGSMFTFSKKNDLSLFPHLTAFNYDTLQLTDLPIDLPTYEPDMRGVYTAYATGEYPFILSQNRVKTYPDYIFGHVIPPERSGIHITDSTEEVYTITDKKEELYSPRFSPDAKYVIYITDDGTQTDIIIASIDGATKRKLIDTPNYHETFPLFSRDGRRILFAADYDGKYSLYTTDLNGSNISLMLSGPNSLIPSDWYYSPSCFDGLKNLDETETDCGGSCGPCGSCTDGLKNQNEAETDCGGVCAPCKEQAIPKAITRNMTLFIGISIGLLFLIALILLFKKQLKKLHHKLSDLFFNRQKREILIDDPIKKKLLKKIDDLEHSKADFKDNLLIYILIGRQYFDSITHLGQEFDYTHLDAALKKKNISKGLKNNLLSLSHRLNTTEFGTTPLKDHHLTFAYEELRTFILLTAPTDTHDLKREHHEYVPDETHDHEKNIYGLLQNIYLALQFDELLVAKKKYLELMQIYRSLPEHKKHDHYENMHRAYHLINYVASLVN